jgi:glutamate---cysteine ligase / carboxylate-amine ligase
VPEPGPRAIGAAPLAAYFECVMPERTPTETARDGDAPYVPRFHDEALRPDGRARPAYEHLIEELAEANLAAVATSLQRSLDALGVSFGEEGGTRPFHVDAVPRLLEASEWNELAAGMRQRARALNAFIADVYDERRIVAAGLVPSRVIDTAEGYEPQLQGVAPPGEHAPVVGFDLVRGGDGRFGVLEENLRTPSGLAYGSAARARSPAWRSGAARSW